MLAEALVAAAMAVATTFYADHGVTMPCTDTVQARPLPAPELAEGYVGQCGVWLDTDYYAGLNALPADRMDRRAQLRTLCVLLAHERGHNMGWNHVPGGIMAEYVEEISPPHECIEWAMSLTPSGEPRTRISAAEATASLSRRAQHPDWLTLREGSAPGYDE